MLSKKEIQKEINRIENNNYKNIKDVEHNTNFENESYLKGLKYALGQNVEKQKFPDKETIEKIVHRIKNQFDFEKIEIERGGIPPTYINVSIYVYKNIDSVDEYQKIESKLRKIAREEESNNERIYVGLRRTK